jgi:hypothetical protein
MLKECPVCQRGNLQYLEAKEENHLKCSNTECRREYKWRDLITNYEGYRYCDFYVCNGYPPKDITCPECFLYRKDHDLPIDIDHLDKYINVYTCDECKKKIVKYGFTFYSYGICEECVKNLH